MDNAFIANPLNTARRAPNPGHRLVNRLLRRLRINTSLTPAPYRWGMANVEARMNLFHLASQVCAFSVPGDFVEVGCNAGESSVVIQAVLDGHAGQDRRVHVYDSFAGVRDLGRDVARDHVKGKGAMQAPLSRFEANFRRAGLTSRPEVHAGWFEDTIPSQLPERIAFAMIDCDLHASTAHVLPHVYARMAPNAICMFGVYYDPSVYLRDGIPGNYASPGVKRATDQFFASRPERVCVLYANEYSNGYFRKL
jgi:O-methyltransferase